MPESEIPSPPPEDDPHEVLRAQQERTTARLREKIQLVLAYRSAWESFYTWESQYSEQTLSSLQAPDYEPPAIAFDDLVSSSEDPDTDMIDLSEDRRHATYTRWSYTRRASSVKVHADVVAARPRPIDPFAYPKYESCTPATRNIRHDEDITLLRFIPYADEGDISDRYEDITEPFASFAWQTQWYDIDCEPLSPPRVCAAA